MAVLLYSTAGTGALVKIEGIVDSSKHQTILARNLQTSVGQRKMKPSSTNPSQQRNGMRSEENQHFGTARIEILSKSCGMT